MEYENLGDEYATCTGYFEFVMFEMQKVGDAKAEAIYKQARDTSFASALVLLLQGRSVEMAVKVANAKIELAKETMRKETDNRSENLSILINKYHKPCLAMVDQPPEALLKLGEEILKQK